MNDIWKIATGRTGGRDEKCWEVREVLEMVGRKDGRGSLDRGTGAIETNTAEQVADREAYVR